MDSCFDSGDRKMYEYVQAFTKTISCTEEVAKLVTGLDGFQTGRVPYRCEALAVKFKTSWQRNIEGRPTTSL